MNADTGKRNALRSQVINNLAEVDGNLFIKYFHRHAVLKLKSDNFIAILTPSVSWESETAAKLQTYHN